MNRYKHELLLNVGIELQQIGPESAEFIRELDRIVVDAKARLPVTDFIPPPKPALIPPYEQAR